MSKRILSLLLVTFISLSCALLMSACDDKEDDGITDCAYVQFIPAVDGEVVQYTSYMYASDGSRAHIYLFADEKSKNTGTWEDNCLLKISFNRGFGVDYEIDDKETFVVDIEGWYDMEIRIKEEYYDSSKKIYLNGVDITSLADPNLSTPPVEGSHTLGTFWYDAVFYFLDFGLVKGNTTEYINTLEYK